jgi:hypothetical protein
LYKIALLKHNSLGSKELELADLDDSPVDHESQAMVSERSSLSSENYSERSFTPLFHISNSQSDVAAESSDISNSQSDDTDESGELSNSGSLNASEVDDEQPTTLDYAIKNVETTLDNLTMLAVAIRLSGTTSRLLKADTDFDPQSKELLKLRNHLNFVLLAENRDPIAIKEPAETTANGPSKFSYDSSAMTKVQQRIVEACLKRHNRFLYAQKHATKLGIEHEPQQSEPAPAPAHEAKLEPSHKIPDQMLLPKEQPPVKVQTSQSSPRSLQPTSVALLAGAVSTIASETKTLDQKRIESSTPSQYSGTEISTNASKLQYPSPPKVHGDQRNFRCPCCCQILPQTRLERRRWKYVEY